MFSAAGLTETDLRTFLSDRHWNTADEDSAVETAKSVGRWAGKCMGIMFDAESQTFMLFDR